MRLTWHPPDFKDQHYNYRWSAPYAEPVYFGAPNKPARPWVNTARRQFSISKFFADRMQSREVTPVAVEAEFRATADQFNAALKWSLSSRTYRWPRRTRRRSGEIAGRRRNIIDTGRLLRSQILRKV